MTNPICPECQFFLVETDFSYCCPTCAYVKHKPIEEILQICPNCRRELQNLNIGQTCPFCDFIRLDHEIPETRKRIAFLQGQVETLHQFRQNKTLDSSFIPEKIQFQTANPELTPDPSNRFKQHRARRPLELIERCKTQPCDKSRSIGPDCLASDCPIFKKWLEEKANWMISFPFPQ